MEFGEGDAKALTVDRSVTAKHKSMVKSKICNPKLKRSKKVTGKGLKKDISKQNFGRSRF